MHFPGIKTHSLSTNDHSKKMFAPFEMSKTQFQLFDLS